MDLADFTDLRDNLLLDTSVPSIYTNEYIHAGRIPPLSRLSAIGSKVLNDANAGGNSIPSEAESAEMMHVMFGLYNLRSEMEVKYTHYGWKIVDYVAEIAIAPNTQISAENQPQRAKNERKSSHNPENASKNIGISVTRAMGFPDESTMTGELASDLLARKINGLILARSAATDEDSFYTAVLHIWCQSRRISQLITQSWLNASDAMRDGVIVVCSVASGDAHKYIF